MWLRKPKKSAFTSPTTGIEIIYFKFRPAQDAARFVETKDNMENYAAVSYKHNSVEAKQSMKVMEAPNYTDTEGATDTTDRITYNK